LPFDQSSVSEKKNCDICHFINRERSEREEKLRYFTIWLANAASEKNLGICHFLNRGRSVRKQKLRDFAILSIASAASEKKN